MDKDEKQNSTRERLLEAACDVFAEKGFRDATNREICNRADANIAAVNYYFNSKEDLYAAAWRRAFRESLQEHPPDGGVPPDASAEVRLKGRVRALIHQVADERNQAYAMVHRERAAPTPLLDDVRRECLDPLGRAMADLMRELLGPDVPTRYVHFCVASTVSQCVDVIGRIRHADIQEDKDLPPPLDKHVRDNIDQYAEHVAQFSLAGIRALRARFSGAEGPGEG